MPVWWQLTHSLWRLQLNGNQSKKKKKCAQPNIYAHLELARRRSTVVLAYCSEHATAYCYFKYESHKCVKTMEVQVFWSHAVEFILFSEHVLPNWLPKSVIWLFTLTVLYLSSPWDIMQVLCLCLLLSATAAHDNYK